MHDVGRFWYEVKQADPAAFLAACDDLGVSKTSMEELITEAGTKWMEDLKRLHDAKKGNDRLIITPNS